MRPVPVINKGIQPVEILHIDTVDSQSFVIDLDLNQSEKAECGRLLLELFLQSCQKFNGYIAAWHGDGGYAFFPAHLKTGDSILAAQQFLANLPILTQQTATVLNRLAKADETRRRFRIIAHFAVIHINEDPGYASAHATDLDAVLKYAKALAPIPDELFITDQLREQLGRAQKDLFEPFSEKTLFGQLKTTIYRLQSRPTNHMEIIHERSSAKDLTENEWRYLCNHLQVQQMNIVARNSITTALIQASTNSNNLGQIDDVIRTTIIVRALYNFLRAAYPHYSFRLTVWRPEIQRNEKLLEKVMQYPLTRPLIKRRVSLDDRRFQVVKTFISCSPIATPSVGEARLRDEWFDFDSSEKGNVRDRNSALQLPVYRRTSQIGEAPEIKMLAVLSIDSDKPGFFSIEELGLWTDYLVGYLAELALAEQIRLVNLAQSGRSTTMNGTGESSL